jgi:hypothetical protein
MRTLFICALAASLFGCSCFVSPQAGVEACMGAGDNKLACFDRTAIAEATEPAPQSSDTSSARLRIKSKVAAKVQKPLSAHGREKTRFVMETAKPTGTTAKVEAARSDQPSETPDQIVAQAKIMVAAKLEDPVSAEFGEMKPAMRTNTLG